MRSLLVKGKYVLTMDEKTPIIPNGAVFVDNTEIIDVGSSNEMESSYNADEIIEVRDGIIMPGLINSHNHMYGILSHGIPTSNTPSSFIGFLKDYWWPHVEDVLNKDQIFAAAMMSSIEMIKTGTTCFADILEAPNAIPGALDLEASAVKNTGLRAVLSFEATERKGQENSWKGVEENLSFIKKWNDKDDYPIKGMFSTHTTFTCGAEFLKNVRELANKYPAGIHIHLEEGAYESDYCIANYGKFPVEFYEDIGFLGPDLLASQCVHTKPREAKILRKYGVKLSHMPISNCEVGGGIAPVPNFLEEGLNVGLGTDGYIQDMFEVMRAAFLVHKGYLQNANVMPADTVIRMATIDSARSIGWERVIGSITRGKKADLISVDLKAPTPVTSQNLISYIVAFGNGSLVKDVIVNGELIMKNREILSVDESLVRDRCLNAAKDLWMT